ncbi:LOW QUALITY PROTEIN: zinc finger protein 414 [Ctenodactylus gundi]
MAATSHPGALGRSPVAPLARKSTLFAGRSRCRLTRGRQGYRKKKSIRIEDGERGSGDAGAAEQRELAGSGPARAHSLQPTRPHIRAPARRGPMVLSTSSQEEGPSGPSSDVLATGEPAPHGLDKEAFPVVAAAATSCSSVEEEPGPDRATTPPISERGPRETQQDAPPTPDSCQPGPGPGPTATFSGSSEDLRPPKRRPPSEKQIPCSSAGCCLSFPSVRDLAQHLRTHCPPTQSLEGKLFHCSALSCTESFPSMEQLVAHSKLHYKPNRYFKCENCLLRFRTHRSLFKHLHVCAEHAQSPPPPPPPPALDKEPSSAPERPPESEPTLASTVPFPLLEPFTTNASAPSGPFTPYLSPAPFGLGPPRLRPFPAAAAPGPPASSAAIWKKGQGACGSPRRPQGGSDSPAGPAAPSRIVWEHTRGRYSCLQCAFSTASRPAMTLHLQEHRAAPAAPPPPRPDAPAGKAGAREGGKDGPAPVPRPDATPRAAKASPLRPEGELPVLSPL